MMRNTLIGALALFVCSTPVLSQPVGNEQLVRAALLAEPSESSQTILIALRFEMAPGWYLYWINPGDSGLPIEIVWDLPEGFQIESISYPVPEKYISDESVSYGFKKQLLLLGRVRVPRPLTPDQPIRLRAMVDWLACKESCVRGSAELVIDLNAIDPDQRLSPSIIRNALAHAPRQSSGLGLEASHVQLTRDREAVRLTVRLSGSNSSRFTDFFPEPIDGFTIEHSGIAMSGGVLTIPLTAHSADSRLSIVRGLLMEGRTGYEIEIPVSYKAVH